MCGHLAPCPFLMAVTDLVAHRFEGLQHGGAQCVVRGFGFHIWSRRDQVHGYAEGRTCFVTAF